MTGPADPGPLLASGRDSEIFDLGGGRVLRRPRTGRSLAGEATVMRHVADAGYPVPRVDDVLADGSLVMERVSGPTMLEDLAARPWRLTRHAAVLADLLDRLARVPAPAGLRPAPLPGAAVVHLDLHPGNVLLSPAGPVVIDWANAAGGDPACDPAVTWLLCTEVGEVAAGLRGAVVGMFRRRFADAVVDHLDRAAMVRARPVMAAWKASHANLSAAEVAALRRYVGRP